MSEMRIVNGYPCRNCSEAALAKRGVDPRDAVPGDPTGEVSRSRSALDHRAVTFGGALAELNAGAGAREPALGRLVDIAA